MQGAPPTTVLKGRPALLDHLDDLALLFHGRGEQGAHADDVGVELLGLGDERLGGHVAAQVGDLVAVGLEVGDDDGLADVVHVALHGAEDDDALGLGGPTLEGRVA